jgi:hypothetical protein
MIEQTTKGRTCAAVVHFLRGRAHLIRVEGQVSDNG